MNDKDRGGAHCETHERAANDCAWNQVCDRIRRIKEKNGKGTSGEHKQREFKCFENIEKPVSCECAAGRSLPNPNSDLNPPDVSPISSA